MKLVLYIALTHVRFRLRQTLVAVACQVVGWACASAPLAARARAISQRPEARERTVREGYMDEPLGTGEKPFGTDSTG